ncbi:MAG: V-type ATP synthase subunit A [Acidimicrobiales bacterium]
MSDHPSSGRVERVNGPLVEVSGLKDVAALDVIEVGPLHIAAEVVAIRDGRLTAEAFEYTGGLRVGDEVTAQNRPLSARLGPGLLGGIFDGLLRPLEGGPTWLEPGSLAALASTTTWSFVPAPIAVGTSLGPGSLLGILASDGDVEHRVLVPPDVSGTLTWLCVPCEITESEPVATIDDHDVTLFESWPVRRARPARARLRTNEPLVTGQRVVDLFFPVALGATAAVPGGFGTGKTMLLQQIVKWADVEVVIFVGCGERGNELADAVADLMALKDPKTGRDLRERTVVIANTSNMPVMARVASVYTGMTVAEYYRDMGYRVVILADSTSRWAEALREFSSRSGELPAEEGYPASLSSSLAAFYERAARVTTLGGTEGSVTLIGAVSPAGGDMTEPVTSQTVRYVRSLWSLDRDLAYARHYPAVSWRHSFSLDDQLIANWHATEGRVGWSESRARALALLAEADRLASVVELVGLGALPSRERVVMLTGRLLREGVLQQSALSENDAYCSPEKQSALLDMVLAVYDRCLALLEGGLPASAIEEFDLTAVTRARDETGPDDDAGVNRLRDEVLAGMAAS